MEAISGRARSFGKEPKTIYENARLRIFDKISIHSDILEKYSDEKFYFNGQRYVSKKVVISDDIKGILSQQVEKTFYSIIGSYDMIALSLIFLHDEGILSDDKIKITSSSFKIEKVYPYYMSYYNSKSKKEEESSPRRREPSFDIEEDKVVQFVNFTLSFSENVINCRKISLKKSNA